jgi:hypothetical protein
MSALNQARREAQLQTQVPFLPAHVTVVSLVIESSQVQQAVEQQNADLSFDRMALGPGLAPGGIERDGNVTGTTGRDPGKGQHIGRRIVAAKGAVQSADVGIVHQP